MTEELREAIHFEYISTDVSIRQLAAKYGVGKSVIERMIKKGGWSVEKKTLHETAQRTARGQTEAKTRQYVSRLTERAEAIYSATDKLLALVDMMLATAEAMAPRDLQAMSSTLLNIKQLHDIKPEVEEEGKSNEVKVVFEGNFEDWAG